MDDGKPMDGNVKEPTNDALKECLVAMAVESWRFGRVASQLLEKLSPVEQSRHAGQLRWFHRSIEDALELAGLRLVITDGQRFDSGMAATPLNIEDFDAGDDLIVDQMLEPIVMGPHGIVKSGTVILRKAAE